MSKQKESTPLGFKDLGDGLVDIDEMISFLELAKKDGAKSLKITCDKLFNDTYIHVLKEKISVLNEKRFIEKISSEIKK